MAVLADVGTDKVIRLKALAPSIDVLGLNAYGGALPSLVARARAQGWTGPIVVTELGVVGQWQVPTTPWGRADRADQHREGAPARSLSRRGGGRRRRRHRLPVGSEAGGDADVAWPPDRRRGLDAERRGARRPLGRGCAGRRPRAAHRRARLRRRRHRRRRLGGIGRRLVGPVGFVGPRRHGACGARGARSRRRSFDGDVDDPRGKPRPADRRRCGNGAARAPRGARGEWATGRDDRGLPPGHYRLFVTVADGKGAVATGNLPFEVR